LRPRLAFQPQNMQPVQRVRALSVADFRRFFVAPMLPVVLVGVAAEWPAIARWSDESYLQSVAGEAHVDVEVGRHFLDAQLEVQRSTLSCFMRQHLHVSASARKRTAEPHALQSRTSRVCSATRIIGPRHLWATSLISPCLPLHPSCGATLQCRPTLAAAAPAQMLTQQLQRCLQRRSRR